MSDSHELPRHAVVVGVDGSGWSWTAIRAAAWEARQRGQALILAHGYFERMPYLAYGWSPYDSSLVDALDEPKAMLAEAARRIRDLYPDLTVHLKLMAGGGASVLTELSRTASLVVVGSRGHGGFAGLSLGSVAAQTAAHATSPVLVIRQAGGDADEAPSGEMPVDGPVLVGINGTSHDAATLRFAFEEASLRQVPLIGVHVWGSMAAADLRANLADGRDYDDAAAHADAERAVAEAMAGWSEKFPEVATERRTIHALNPSYALIQASVAAGLVVVGSRGRGGFMGLLLGSVGRDLVGHSYAPVAVVHSDDARDR